MDYKEACKVFDLDRKSKFHTADNIKAIYRRLCKKHHPDKGGDVSKMQQVNVAYDTLLKHLKDNHYANTYQDTEDIYNKYHEWFNFRKTAEETFKEGFYRDFGFKSESKSSQFEQKDVPPRKTPEEIVQEILTWETNNLHVSILKTTTIHGNPKKSIVVSGNTYTHKEKLKEFGFTFDFDVKVWKYN